MLLLLLRPCRINDAPTKGYEEDVGSRCTMRVVYPMTAVKEQQARDQNDTIALFVPFKAADIDWILKVVRGVVVTMKTGPFKWDVPPHNVRILNPIFMRVASLELLNNSIPTRKKRAPIPTTGFLTVTAALHMCREVHIAGFGYPKATKNVGNELVHYYGEGRMRPHRLDAIIPRLLLHIRSSSISSKLLLSTKQASFDF
ncbi:CMP-N-acetylneuraminate-beta-galactosamide-alpha-2,3-sialyltransferase 4-like [Petromyzon marinus]|uniref:CMP-N-acetylneuraminate-beta-galactosamide- alpha-2,3-sialyltransferase 4-like n=1 Tax=Petromyzon marinus TaxID=7757 RepID=UPI003F714067